MNILMAFNGRYMSLAMVLVRSLADNVAGEIIIHIFHSELTENEQQRICMATADCPRIKYEFYEVNGEPYEEMSRASYVSKETYYRLLNWRLLPTDIDRVLYLDTDIIIDGDISGFYNQDFEGKLIAACPDPGKIPQDIPIDHIRRNLNIREDIKYCNAGVLLYNLKAMRTEVSESDMLTYIDKYKDSLYMADQDIINGFYAGRIKYCNPLVYNYAAKRYVLRKYGREAAGNALIIHFALKYKPFSIKYTGILSERFWKYADRAGVEEYKRHPFLNSLYRMFDFVFNPFYELLRRIYLKYSKKMPKHVNTKVAALIGAGNSDNLGDGCLCECAKKLIESKYPYCYVEDIDIWGRTVNHRYNVPVRMRQSLKNAITGCGFMRLVIDTVRRLQRRYKLSRIDWSVYDYAVYAGGELFRKCFFSELKYIAKQLHKHNIPLYYNAISYEIKNESDKARICKILNIHKPVSITTRDNAGELNSMLGIKTVLQAQDPALMISSLYPEDNICKGKVGVGVINSKAVKNIIKDIIHELDNRKEDWELFTNGDFEDYAFAENLLKEIGKEEKLAPRPAETWELCKTIAGYKAITAFRLHASIIATSYGVPCAGIMMSNKVKCFYDNIGKSDKCFEPCTSGKDIIGSVLD